MTPAPAAPPMTDHELRYLTVLARWLLCTSPDGWHYCAECGAESHLRDRVVHRPGCVFHGLDARTLAAISADWMPT